MENKLDPVAVRQEYIKNQTKAFGNWNLIFGQQVAIYRFVTSETPNVEKARRVFGNERVQNNMSRLTFIQNIKIPVAFDAMVSAYADRAQSVEFLMPNDIIKINDILVLDYLNQKLEFVVENEVQSQYEAYFRYEIRTRKSEPNSR